MVGARCEAPTAPLPEVLVSVKTKGISHNKRIYSYVTVIYGSLY
jgi:hypothetical protein